MILKAQHFGDYTVKLDLANSDHRAVLKAVTEPLVREEGRFYESFGHSVSVRSGDVNATTGETELSAVWLARAAAEGKKPYIDKLRTLFTEAGLEEKPHVRDVHNAGQFCLTA